jgi:FixJ family two-component response regulator
MKHKCIKHVFYVDALGEIGLEVQIAELLISGKSTHEIARTIRRSPKAVEYYRHKTLCNLGLPERQYN